MNYNQFLRSAGLTNLDLSSDKTNVGENAYGISFEQVNDLHVSCIRASDPNNVIAQIEALTNKGTDLNQFVNEFGFNLLYFVRNRAVLNALIDAGVNPDHRSNGQDHAFADHATPACTAFHYACYYFYIEAVKVFVEHVSDINVPDEDGFSPMAYAEQTCSDQAQNKKKGARYCGDEKLKAMEQWIAWIEDRGGKIIKTV